MRKNKPLAGYHLLMILSAVDNKFTAKEDLVIRNWLAEQFPFNVNLDKEIEVLSALDPDDYMIHFQKCMADFYQDSTEEERNELIQFAINLVKADKQITPEENVFLDELFNEWTETQI
jgi:uncharacterized tellurite resistance protein B-like protein